jgi:hypothetical protein
MGWTISSLQICLAIFFSSRERFKVFLRESFDRAYSSLFVYQVQLFNPELLSCVVDVAAAVHGKGDQTTIEILQTIPDMLHATVSNVVGHAFDGDSCFNGLQNRFRRVETTGFRYPVDPSMIPESILSSARHYSMR